VSLEHALDTGRLPMSKENGEIRSVRQAGYPNLDVAAPPGNRHYVSLIQSMGVVWVVCPRAPTLMAPNSSEETVLFTGSLALSMAAAPLRLRRNEEPLENVTPVPVGGPSSSRVRERPNSGQLNARSPELANQVLLRNTTERTLSARTVGNGP
jgi:hypothetical protein